MASASDRTSLFTAVRKGNYTIVENLLNDGADVHEKDSDGLAAIHHAAVIGRVDIAKLLMDRKSSLDIQTNTGWTPLHWAAKRRHNTMVQWLLQQGVDITITDNKGDTAADYAELRDRKELAAMIRSYTTSNTAQQVQQGAGAATAGQQQVQQQQEHMLTSIQLFRRQIHAPMASGLPYHWALTFTWKNGVKITHEAFAGLNGMLKHESTDGGPEHGQEWAGSTWVLEQTYEIDEVYSTQTVENYAKSVEGGEYNLLRNNCQTFAVALAKKFNIDLPIPGSTILDTLTSKSLSK